MKLRALIAPAWRRQWRWLAFGVALMLAASAAALALLGLAGWLITAGALAGLGLIAAVDIFTPGGGIRLAAITRTAARYGERLVTHRATLGLLAALRTAVLERLLRLDEVQLRRLERGDAFERLTRDVETLDHLFAGVVGPAVTAVLTTLGVVLLVQLAASPAAAVVIAALGAAATALTIIMGRLGIGHSRALARQEPDLRRMSAQSLEGLKSLIAEGQVDAHRHRMDRLGRPIANRQRALDRVDAVGEGAILLVGLAAVWSMLIIALAGAAAGAFSGPVAVMALIVTLGLVEVWQALPSAWRQLARSRLAVERITEMAGREPMLSTPAAALPLPAGRELQMRAVEFTWPGSLRPILKDFNLAVAEGERLVVAGPSGSGKTTLGLLLMRQLDPDAGTVLLGGCDLRRLDPNALRGHIGYLPQRPVVFRDTLAANLRVARPDADSRTLASALHDAGLDEWLATLEQGLETWLDEAGGNLSGGELRRLGLARLMLVDPAVVVLDEPTTGLDRHTAQRLAASLDSWLAGRTAVMISHEPELLPRYGRLVTL